ncbi:MAG: ParA family protein [Anaerolineales bacterium]|jgi:chromosome partitioning protein
MAFTIAIANLKGGVAKTTTTASLAGTLNQLGYRVLAVDLDAQANLTTGLGVRMAEAHQTVVDVFFNWMPLSQASVATDISRLDLVASHPDLALAERFLPVRRNFETILRQSAESSGEYDFILLDCPPFLGAVTLNALNAANMLIIPTLPEIYSWESLQKTIQYAQKIKARSNPNLAYRILICMLDARLRIHREIVGQYREHFGDKLFNNLIQIDTRLRESAVAGKPINYYDANTRSARQYQSLAEEIKAYVQQRFFASVDQQNIEYIRGTAVPD